MPIRATHLGGGAGAVLLAALAFAGPATAVPPDRYCGTIGGPGNEAHANGSPLATCATTRRVLGKYFSTRRRRIEKWTCRRTPNGAVFVICTHAEARLTLYDGSYGE